MSTHDDGTISDTDMTETRQGLARRMAVATLNIRVVQQTAHQLYHHEQHTMATCPMESCILMGIALRALPTSGEILNQAKAESAEAKAMLVDGKRSPKTQTSTSVRRTPVDV